MIRFQLHEFIKGAMPRMIYKSTPDGVGRVNSRMVFEPGVEYTATDETLIRLIKGEIGDIRQKSVLTKELKQTLASYGIPYEPVRCTTCAGARTFALYNPFNILEEK